MVNSDKFLITMAVAMIKIIFLGLVVQSLSFPSSSFENEDISTLIIGGEDAKAGEFPYQIQIWDLGNHSCAGSLITVKNTQLVLTAATCLEYSADIKDVTVIGGDLKISEISGAEQERKVTGRILHPDFDYWDSWDPEHDIALLSIDRPFNLNENISPINLPQSGQNATGMAVSSGWGDTDRDRESWADNLQKVTLPIVSDEVCADKYKFNPISKQPKPSMICAGPIKGEGKGPCWGDIGGPLKALDGNYLAGVAIFGGRVCGTSGYPFVFTEVSHYVDWINEAGSSLASGEAR